jgi:hypothetical protein
MGNAWRGVAISSPFEGQVRLICRAEARVDLNEARCSRWPDTVELLEGRAPGYLVSLLTHVEG